MIKSIFIGMILFYGHQGFAANSYNIAASASTTIDEHGVCRIVTNNSAKAMFIPTKTNLEWTQVRNATSAPNISMGFCPGDPDAITAWNPYSDSNNVSCGIISSTETVTTTTGGSGVIYVSVSPSGDCQSVSKFINGVETAAVDGSTFTIQSGNTLALSIVQGTTFCGVDIELRANNASGAVIGSLNMVNNVAGACF